MDASTSERSFRRGLRAADVGAHLEALNPRHAGLVGELRGLGIRRKPLIRLFGRAHPVNRILGRLRRGLLQVAPDSRQGATATGG